MTDRAQGFIVHLDDDYRLGDSVEGFPPLGADAIAHAITSIKGVVSVTAIVTELTDHMARERVRADLRVGLLRVIEEITRP